jgi:1-aminocyclopropane-1-carboxylate deaminase
LQYYLQDARAADKTRIATFGGAYSNHILATAAAGKLFGFKTTGIIRGERPKNLSHTLLQAMQFEMELVFTNRADYSDKKLPAEIKPLSPYVYLINEGGYGIVGAKGAAQILTYCEKEIYSHIACAVGTSTMMAGLIKASVSGQKVYGVSVLKNKATLSNELRNLLLPEERKKPFELIHEYHFGGYAKPNPGLINFMNEFYESTAIPTDFVYTAKLFYAVRDIITKNFVPEGSHILVIHSGGLQGNLSLPEGTLIF